MVNYSPSPNRDCTGFLRREYNQTVNGCPKLFAKVSCGDIEPQNKDHYEEGE